jgi:hypothetical protein
MSKTNSNIGHAVTKAGHVLAHYDTLENPSAKAQDKMKALRAAYTAVFVKGKASARAKQTVNNRTRALLDACPELKDEQSRAAAVAAAREAAQPPASATSSSSSSSQSKKRKSPEPSKKATETQAKPKVQRQNALPPPPATPSPVKIPPPAPVKPSTKSPDSPPPPSPGPVFDKHGLMLSRPAPPKPQKPKEPPATESPAPAEESVKTVRSPKPAYDEQLLPSLPSEPSCPPPGYKKTEAAAAKAANGKDEAPEEKKKKKNPQENNPNFHKLPSDEELKKLRKEFDEFVDKYGIKLEEDEQAPDWLVDTLAGILKEIGVMSWSTEKGDKYLEIKDTVAKTNTMRVPIPFDLLEPLLQNRLLFTGLVEKVPDDLFFALVQALQKLNFIVTEKPWEKVELYIPPANLSSVDMKYKSHKINGGWVVHGLKMDWILYDHFLAVCDDADTFAYSHDAPAPKNEMGQ